MTVNACWTFKKQSSALKDTPYADAQALRQDELIQTWVLHHLQIIGEAVRTLSPEFIRQHAQVDWTQIIGMRNILVHNYFGIDVAIVWLVVERNLPLLKKQITVMLDDTSEPSP